MSILKLIAAAVLASVALQAQTLIDPSQINFLAYFASPPRNPRTGGLYVFRDATATGVCVGGGTALAICSWNGFAFATPAGSGGGGGGAGIWGTITGSLPAQTDLATALAGKEPTVTAGTSLQYYRGDKSWQTLNTAAVAESGNLYFTNARAQSAMSGLYQAPITTGSTTQYLRGDLSLAAFPTTWAWASLSGVPTLTNTVFGRSGTVTAQSGDYTTTQVTEGTNLYFTTARAQAAVSGLYQAPITTGSSAQYFRGDLSLATFPTTWAWASLSGVPSLANTVFGRSGTVIAQSGDYNTSLVTESGNLYYTNARAQAAMAGLYEVPLTFSGPLSRTVNAISLLTWGNGSRPVAASALGVAGNCMSWGTAGAADFGSPCGTGGGGGGANSLGYYWVGQGTNAPVNASNLGALSPGLLKIAVSAGVATPATAAPGTDYQAPITTGTTAQYFRGDLSLATFPTTWAWAALSGVPSMVNTVFGRSGTVTAQNGDYTTTQVTEGTNLYFTNARAQLALAGLYQAPITTGSTTQYIRGDLSLATFPTTWAWANLSSVPTLTNTVFGRSGTVTAQNGDYTTTQVTEGTNLYFTNARAQPHSPDSIRRPSPQERPPNISAAICRWQPFRPPGHGLALPACPAPSRRRPTPPATSTAARTWWEPLLRERMRSLWQAPGALWLPAGCPPTLAALRLRPAPRS